MGKGGGRRGREEEGKRRGEKGEGERKGKEKREEAVLPQEAQKIDAKIMANSMWSRFRPKEAQATAKKASKLLTRLVHCT
jgi:hypothetical protein